MRLGFSTLGCPDWDLETMCARAHDYGFEGVDFRGLGEHIDVTMLPEFTSGLAITKRLFSNHGVVVSGISSSLKICESTLHDENLEEAKRTIPIALDLDVDTIRVFGGGDTAAFKREDLADIGCRTMESVLRLDGAESLKWIFETHDSWIAASDAKLLLDRIPHAAFGVLWDVGHTSRVGGETPIVSMSALGDRIYGLHIKDAVHDDGHPNAMPDGWRYVKPGEGELPIAEAIHLLRQAGYDDWLLFEHEKRWHPELSEPEKVFPEFVSWYRSLEPTD
jgi:sugar phosphate isomerase/epimerase